HGEWRLRRGRPPRLDPGHAAGLQLGDDLAGDVVVKARPVGAGASMAVVSGHRGSPRRAPEASPPALNPSRQTRSALSLSIGGVAGSPRETRVGRDRGSAAGEGFPRLAMQCALIANYWAGSATLA